MVFRFFSGTVGLGLTALLLVLSQGCNNGVSGTTTPAAGQTSTTAYVLDSINGVALAGATVTAYDPSGTAVTLGKTDTTGAVNLTLAPGTYTLEALVSGRSAGTLQDYVAPGNGAVGLYCYSPGVAGTAAISPHFEAVNYSADGGETWVALGNGAVLPTAKVELQVVSAGVIAVMDDGQTGYGVSLDFDRLPTNRFNILVPAAYTSVAVPVTTGNDLGFPADVGKYQTTAVFDLRSTVLVSGSHTLELVSYDLSNNRAEKHVTLTLP